MSDEALPIAIYSHNLGVIQKYKIQSDTAETVAVVHTAQEVVDQKEGSKLVHHYENVHRGLMMMRERLQLITAYVVACQEGKVKPNNRTLRNIKGICNRLPSMQTAKFKNEFQGEFNDTMLLTYLSSITKNSSSLGAIMSNFNSVFGAQGRSFMRYEND